MSAASSTLEEQGEAEPELKVATQSCASATEDDSRGGTVVVMERLLFPHPCERPVFAKLEGGCHRSG
jgi:hypothetical protein